VLPPPYPPHFESGVATITQLKLDMNQSTVTAHRPPPPPRGHSGDLHLGTDLLSHPRPPHRLRQFVFEGGHLSVTSLVNLVRMTSLSRGEWYKLFGVLYQGSFKFWFGRPRLARRGRGESIVGWGDLVWLAEVAEVVESQNLKVPLSTTLKHKQPFTTAHHSSQPLSTTNYVGIDNRCGDIHPSYGPVPADDRCEVLRAGVHN